MKKTIVYIGHSDGMTLTLPVGARGKSIKSKVDLLPGKPIELDAQDADALLLTNQRLLKEVIEENKALKPATIENDDVVEETVVEEEKSSKKRGPVRRKG